MRFSEKEILSRKKIYYQNVNIKCLENKIIELQNEISKRDIILNSKSIRLLNKLRELIFKVRVFVKNKLKMVQNKQTISSSYNVFNYFPLNLETQSNEVIDKISTDIKPLAFYFLDDYVNGNDISWSRITAVKPKHENHYQPRKPSIDFGYYDLSISTLRKQMLVAKQHGIYGFCYMYKLKDKNHKKFLNKMLLSNIDMPYVICLDISNENLETKKNLNLFIDEIYPYLIDDRCIKINSIPILMFNNTFLLTDFCDVITKIRELLKKKNIDILIWQDKDLNDSNQTNLDYIDGEFQFYFDEESVLSKDSLNLYDYDLISKYVKKNYRSHASILPYYYSVSLPVDFTPLQHTNPRINYNFNVENFSFYVNEVIRQTRDTHDECDRFIFINSWNNWKVGNYLEPDYDRGYSYLNAFSKTLYGFPLDDNYILIDKNTPKLQILKNKKVAVQIHLFYTDLIEEICRYLKNIPYDFDCYISTDTNDKKVLIEKKFSEILSCNKVVVDVFENRGRDILPFLLQMKQEIYNYDYVCHIHTKKTVTNNHGERWRKYLYNNLFGSEEIVRSIFYLMEHTQNLGVIFPCIYSDVINDCTIVGNEVFMYDLANRLNISVDGIRDGMIFPASSMFWFKTEAIQNLFEIGLDEKDFPDESSQVDATYAHAVERMFCYIAEQNGYDSLQIIGKLDLKGDI